MPLTKAQYRTAIREAIDDPNGKRWSDNSLDQLTEFVLDDLWGEILDMAPYINSQYQQIGLPLHSPGYIDLRTTDVGGDLTQRMYRVQQVIADGRHYFAKDPRDFLMVASSQTNDVTTIRASTGVEQRFSFQFLGNQMWLHPLGNVTTFVELRYNFKPVGFTSLTNGFQVDLPEGSHKALVYLTAADALAKGNAEDATQVRSIGLEAKARMMDSIRRQYHGMIQPFAPSNMWEWGGI
jgi:hypothetical protein